MLMDISSWARTVTVACAVVFGCMAPAAFSQDKKMSVDEFREYIHVPNFNQSKFRFDSRTPGKHADLMEGYTSVIEDEFRNGSFREKPDAKSHVYELMRTINYHLPVSSPVIWDNVADDVTSDNMWLRYRAANFAKFSPETHRERILHNIINSIDRFGMGDPTGQLLQTVVHLVRDGDQSTADYLKLLLDIQETTEGEKIFAILAMLNCNGVDDTIEFMNSRDLDERVAAGSALVRFKTDSKGYTNREEASLIRKFIADTTVQYLLTPESEQNHPDYLSALINALLRTVGNDPFDTSPEQLAVNLEVAREIRRVLLTLDDESRLATGLNTILERFSEDGTYTR